MLTQFTLELIPVFRALLQIEIELRNTSSFLGLYSRSRSRSISGTHPRFYGSTRDWDWDRTTEHILIFRALLEIEIKIEIAPVHGRGMLCTSLTTQKKSHRKGTINIQTDKQTDKQTYFVTTRPTPPRGPSWWQKKFKTKGFFFFSFLRSNTFFKKIYWTWRSLKIWSLATVLNSDSCNISVLPWWMYCRWDSCISSSLYH